LLLVLEHYRFRALSKRGRLAPSSIQVVDQLARLLVFRRPNRICTSQLQDRRLLLWAEKVFSDRRIIALLGPLVAETTALAQLNLLLPVMHNAEEEKEDD
jgi:hypothetical protein